MKATAVLNEMAKSKTLYGYAAGLYVNDEIMAIGFLHECYEQYHNHPELFKSCFGEEAYLKFRQFWIQSNN